MPILNKCCCCFSLPTGGVILGVLGIINKSLLTVVLPTVELIYLDDTFADENARHEAVRDVGNGGNFTNYENLSTMNFNPRDWNLKNEQTELLVKIILIVIIVVNIFVLISSVLLIIGAIRKRKEFIIPYLITDPFGIVFMILYFIKDAASVLNMKKLIISGIIYLLFAGYLWLCVLSLYQWIKENSRPPAPPAIVRSSYPEQKVVYSKTMVLDLPD